MSTWPWKDEDFEVPKSEVSRNTSQAEGELRDLSKMPEAQKEEAYREWLEKKGLKEVEKKAKEQAMKELARRHPEEMQEIMEHIMGEKLKLGVDALKKGRKKPGKE
jgi:hypothetical protein